MPPVNLHSVHIKYVSHNSIPTNISMATPARHIKYMATQHKDASSQLTLCTYQIHISQFHTYHHLHGYTNTSYQIHSYPTQRCLQSTYTLYISNAYLTIPYLPTSAWLHQHVISNTWLPKTKMPPVNLHSVHIKYISHNSIPTNICMATPTRHIKYMATQHKDASSQLTLCTYQIHISQFHTYQHLHGYTNTSYQIHGYPTQRCLQSTYTLYISNTCLTIPYLPPSAWLHQHVISNT